MKDNSERICPYCDRKVKTSSIGRVDLDVIFINALKKHLSKYHKTKKCKICRKPVSKCNNFLH